MRCPEKVDPIWHTHVLFTIDYKQFCEKVSPYFMHHIPLDHDNRPEVRNIRRLYEYTIECMHTFFNYVNENLWTNASVTDDYQLMCTHHSCSIESVKAPPLLPFRADLQPDAVFVS